jgi:RimJ/RimL family protein N-acetyltransferase
MLQLRDYSSDDKWLSEALECDPEVMKDLGGITPPEKIDAVHERRLRLLANPDVWCLVVLLEPKLNPIGTIGVWPSECEGEKIFEMGWMILPKFQKRGYASEAGRLILARAAETGKFSEIVAFPASSNGASNAICRKLGFTLIKEVDIAYNGPPQPSNYWKIVLGR